MSQPGERCSIRIQALLQVLLVIMMWLLIVAPIGVFTLAFECLVPAAGFPSAGALAAFVGVVIVLLLTMTTLCYPAASLIAALHCRVSFARQLPPQAVAMGTRSSIASLPALLESGQRPACPSM